MTSQTPGPGAIPGPGATVLGLISRSFPVTCLKRLCPFGREEQPQSRKQRETQRGRAREHERRMEREREREKEREREIKGQR